MKCAGACVCVCGDRDKEEEKEERKAEGEAERSCCPQDPSLQYAVRLHALSSPHSRDLRRVNTNTDAQITESVGILEHPPQPRKTCPWCWPHPSHALLALLALDAARTGGAGPCEVVQAPGSNGPHRLHMLCGAAVSGADARALSTGHLFRITARGAAGAAGAGQHHVPAAAWGRFHFLRSSPAPRSRISGLSPRAPPRPRLPSRPCSPRTAGPGPPLPPAASARPPRSRPPASPPSSWCGPWRAHHGDRR